MKLELLSIEKRQNMSDVQVQWRTEQLDKAATQALSKHRRRLFFYSFLLFSVFTAVMFGTDVASGDDFKYVFAIFCIIMTVTMFSSIVPYIERIAYLTEKYSFVPLTEISSDYADKALRFVAESSEAAEWRESAVRAGRSLRMFDFQQMELLHKQQCSDFEAKRHAEVCRMLNARPCAKDAV